MSDLAYKLLVMEEGDKPLVWLHGEVKTPPMSAQARLEAGHLLRRLQRGEILSMPESRPMPSIGLRCHELRIGDADVTWRIFYRIDRDAILILDVIRKKTRSTPRAVIEVCQRRLADYDRIV
jgi:phage-related protein